MPRANANALILHPPSPPHPATALAGRGSLSPILDLAATLLGLGRPGIAALTAQRDDVAAHLRATLAAVAAAAGERLLASPANTISFAVTLAATMARAAAAVAAADAAAAAAGAPPPSASTPTARARVAPTAATIVGSMLFTRGVSGTRVVVTAHDGDDSGDDDAPHNATTARAPSPAVVVVAGHAFESYGASTDRYASAPYLTAAAAIGLTRADVDEFGRRLAAVLADAPRTVAAAVRRGRGLAGTL